MTIKKILFALMATMTMAFAGGDIAPVAEVAPVQVAPVKNWYVGGALTANQAFEDRDWFSTNDKNSMSYGIGGQLGYVFYRSGDFSTAVEGRITYTFMGDADGSNDFWTGDALIKPAYAFGDVSVYGLAGYTYADYDIANFNESSVDGFVWGGGVEYAIDNTWSVFGDYTVRPEIADGVDNEVVTVGVNYKF